MTSRRARRHAGPVLRVTLLALLCFWLVTSRAEAQTGSDAEAHALFSAGEAAYGEGRYAAALNYFRQAYEMSGRALLLYNIGSAAEHLRRDEEALEAFERYLAETPEDAPDRVAVGARIELLRTELAERAVTSTTPVAATPSAPQEDAVDPAPWITLGVGGALAIVGAILLGVGYADAATFQSAAPGSMWSSVASAHDQAPVLEGTGFALLGVGVAAAAAALIWGLTASREPSASASAWLDARGGGLLLRGAF